MWTIQFVQRSAPSQALCPCWCVHNTCVRNAMKHVNHLLCRGWSTLGEGLEAAAFEACRFSRQCLRHRQLHLVIGFAGFFDCWPDKLRSFLCCQHLHLACRMQLYIFIQERAHFLGLSFMSAHFPIPYDGWRLQVGLRMPCYHGDSWML